MDQLVSTEWLADELGAPDLVVLDCTVFLHLADGGGYVSESGRAQWEQSHIPTAGFADLNEALCDASSPYRYAVPAASYFAAAMAELGVSDDSRVVLYDANRSMWAARVWWMLRWIGFDRAALLDGGMKAWKAEGRELRTDTPTPTRATLSVRERPSLIADKAEVLAVIADGATCLIDALPEASYRGEVNVYGRAGHIPSATNTSAAGLLDPQTGRFLPIDELRAKFPSDPSARVVNYCGGGIAASANAFTLTRLGFEDVAVYTHSLQEWVKDPAAPMSSD